VTLAAFQAPAPQAPRATASQRAAERIRALQKEAEDLATQESALLVQLRRFEVERQLRIEELGQLESDHATTQQALAAAEVRAATLRRTAETERPEIEQRLVRVYKLGQAGFWRLLLDVDNLRSAGRAYRTAAALTRIDRDQRRRSPAHAQALPGNSRSCGNGSRTSRSSRSRRARPARRPTRLSEPDRRSSRRSMPAAI
jgi:hypothetical protein